jgi:N-acetyl sugar amidotransferase
MDTTDPDISFDDDGICNHCHDFKNNQSKRWFPSEDGKKKLDIIIDRVKRIGKDNEYDCIIGLSGGVDSSYVAVIIKDYGLRPLVVHVDAGWNTELAVYNIEQVVKYCHYDLYTHVMDWDEIRDLQLAYLKSGVANQDVIQDHAFFSSLYHFAIKNNIKFIISGGNIATESVFPLIWHHSAMDAINIRDIHRKFGKQKLKQYKTINIWQYYFHYPLIYRMETIRPLNYLTYNKLDALEFLKHEIGFKPYKRKHGESVFTKFFQNYFLYEKFGYDKRKPHLSSMVLSGQISRAQALTELNEPLYDEIELQKDIEYIAKKLQISITELLGYIHSAKIHYTEYRNWDYIFRKIKTIQTFLENKVAKELKIYS